MTNIHTFQGNKTCQKAYYNHLVLVRGVYLYNVNITLSHPLDLV